MLCSILFYSTLIDSPLSSSQASALWVAPCADVDVDLSQARAAAVVVALSQALSMTECSCTLAHAKYVSPCFYIYVHAVLCV